MTPFLQGWSYYNVERYQIDPYYKEGRVHDNTLFILLNHTEEMFLITVKRKKTFSENYN